MTSLFMGAVLIGFAPILIKAVDVGPTMIGVYRCLLGSLMLFLISLRTMDRSQGGLRRQFQRTPIRLWGLLAAAGLFFASDLLVWHRSVIYIGAGLSTLLANTQVLYLAILGVLFFREAMTVRFLLAVPMGFVGVYLLVNFGVGPAAVDRYWTGVVFGLMAGMFYTGFLLALRRADAEKGAGPTSWKISVICAVTALIMFGVALIEGSVLWPKAIDLGYLFLLAAGPQVVGWLLITRGLAQVPISRAGLILLTQPLVAIMMGAWIFDEQMVWLQGAGVVLTLTAIYLGTTRSQGRLAEAEAK